MVWYLYGKPAYNDHPDFANLRIGILSTSEGQETHKPLDEAAVEDLRRKSGKNVRRMDRGERVVGDNSTSITGHSQSNVHVFEKRRAALSELDVLEKLAVASEKHYLYVKGCGKYDDDDDAVVSAEDVFEQNIRAYIDHLTGQANAFRR